MTHLDLFSGIGGFALAARWAGLKTIAFCEIDKFCQKVLNKNFPGVPIYEDIKELKWNGTRPDLLTGGFPCQPFSVAGKQRGKDDNRYLWPEMLRCIQEFHPTWIIGENVAGIINLALEQVCVDLEDNGYEVQPFVIPAVAVNAPHRRDRVWIVAHAKSDGSGGGSGTLCGTEQRQVDELLSEPNDTDLHATNTGHKGLQGGERDRSFHIGGTISYGATSERSRNTEWNQNWLEIATKLCVLDARFSDWMDGHFDDVILEEDYGKITKENRTEGMRILREGISSEEVWDKLGRLFKVDEKKVLLSLLCRIENGANRSLNIQCEGKKNQSGSDMRELWGNAVYRHSPYRREYQEQFSRELTAILPQLPHEISLEVAKIWDYLSCAFSSMTSSAVNIDGYKLTKAGHRVERLKALGNAIVPQVAYEIMLAIKNTYTSQ